MIKLSTKGRYATRIMVYLAVHDNGEPAKKQDIADSEGITPDYIEQILMKLKTANLVKSHRGSKGGFSLARPAAKISVSEILEATEGPTCLTPCLEEKCPRHAGCPTRPLWKEADDALNRIFESKSVADLAKDAEDLNENSPLTFSI